MALKLGDIGEAVVNLKKNLNQLGVAKLNESGNYDNDTTAAVKAFQNAHGLVVDGVVGPKTDSAINQALAAQIGDVPAPWLAWMKSHIGEVEQTGAPATEFDKEVFSHTSYGNLDGVMEPGCAATACAALEETGFKSPHNAAASSFVDFGGVCELVPGCIVVFMWANGEHHVTFCDHIVSGELVACLGGNQGHQVKVSIFSRKYIVATRYPIEKLDAGGDQDQTEVTEKIHIEEGEQ